MAENVSELVPPYLAFATFQAAVQNLRAHGLPTQLDRSTWGSRSGAEQGQIWGAFRFLALVDAQGTPQALLKILVQAAENTTDEKAATASLLRENYGKVFALDLKTLTPKQMDDAIGEYGVTGATRKRAVRFFIKAATHAGIQLSTRLTANLRERSTTDGEAEPDGGNGDAAKQPLPKQPRKKKRQNSAPIPPALQGQTANAMKTIQLPGVGGTLTLSATFNPLQLKGDERALVYLIVDKMDEFEQKSHTANE